MLVGDSPSYGRWSPRLVFFIFRLLELLESIFLERWRYVVHYNICHIPQRQIRGIPGDLSLGIRFPGDMSPGISGTEKLKWDSFPGDIPGRHRRPHIVSVKQLSATVK
ncbi:hypothetical protein Tco_1013489, partial [Tanacetum coccineum]